MAVETECLCAEVYPKIDEIIEQKGAQTDSLIEILHAVQQEVGYLPQAVQEYVAEKLDVPAGVVESVVTFYTFFTTVPRGRYLVKVCQGTACYVRGGKRVLEAVEKHCGCSVGETSEDRRYSVDIVRCLGACGLSPVMTVGDDIYERVKTTKVADILEKYE
jgi:NADH:ubiquinone oxidoreductase subunit E